MPSPFVSLPSTLQEDLKQHLISQDIFLILFIKFLNILYKLRVYFFKTKKEKSINTIKKTQKKNI